MYIFTVDGNIGSGKSTLIKLLKKKYRSLGDKKIVFLPIGIRRDRSLKKYTIAKFMTVYWKVGIKMVSKLL